MSYEMYSPSSYSSPRAKQKQKLKKQLRLVAYLLISVLIQFSMLFSLDIFFKQMSGIDIEPETTTEVQERRVVLNPPLNTPGMMAVSTDHSRFAVADKSEIRIYDLKDGRQISKYSVAGRVVGSLQWLPDRNRLIFALIDTKFMTSVITSPIRKGRGSVFDEAYSTDSYRQPGQITASERFQIALYGLEGTRGASPELIQTLRQEGPAPQKVNLSLSTYTNLLFVHWHQLQKDNLIQIDIMNRIKDIALPKGTLSKLVVSPQNGNLWAEMTEDNSLSVYLYQKGRWKLKTYLDGYRLLGASSDDSLAVAPDYNGFAKEVQLVNDKGEFKDGWSFTDPIQLEKVRILKDGRLLYLDNGRVIVHSAKLGEGTLFNTEIADCYSNDGKMVLTWIESTNELLILEEMEATKKE